MKKKNILVERLLAKTPLFWKRVRAFALSIGISAVAAITLIKTMELNILPLITQVIEYTIVICGSIAGTAQLTKEDR